MTSARLFVQQIPLFALGVLTITVGSYWLVPRLGLRGAIIASIAGLIIQLIVAAAILGYSLMTQRKEATSLA
jgi:hypothetical protein